MREPTEIAFGIPPLLRNLLFLPLLVGLLCALAVVFAALAWKNGYWKRIKRVHYTLVTVAGLAFLWWLNYWNLLGWQF